MEAYNQRAYSRGSHFGFEVKISIDGKNWKKAHVTDLSSGGLKLHTKEMYHKGEVVWFDLLIHSFMAEFALKVQGKIQHHTKQGHHHVYGVEFLNLSPDIKIRIDESVHNDRPIEKQHYETDW